MLEALIVVAALAGLVLLWAILTFNRLIRLRQMMREGWSGIDVQLKRRADLVPNLVETVKAYKIYEQDVLERVTRLRSEAVAAREADGPEAIGEKEGELAGALVQLFAVAEAYPDLKASEVFLDLQNNLVEVEDHLQMARRYYNGTVRNLNIKVESVPSNIIAGMFRFVRAQYFQLEDPAQRAAPKVAL